MSAAGGSDGSIDSEKLYEVTRDVGAVLERVQEQIEQAAEAGRGEEVADELSGLVEATDELVNDLMDLHEAEGYAPTGDDGGRANVSTTTAEIPAGGRTNVERRKEGKTNDTVEVPERGSDRQTTTREVPLQGGDVDDPDTTRVNASEPDPDAAMRSMVTGWRDPRFNEALEEAAEERKQRRQQARERREKRAREAGSHYMNMSPEDVDDVDVPAGGRSNVEQRREDDDDA